MPTNSFLAAAVVSADGVASSAGETAVPTTSRRLTPHLAKRCAVGPSEQAPLKRSGTVQKL